MSTSTSPPGSIVLFVISTERVTLKSLFPVEILSITSAAEPEFVPMLNLVFPVVSPIVCGIYPRDEYVNESSGVGGTSTKESWST